VLCAVGVDSQGKKHVLGLVEGASENAAAATSLLEDLVARGVDPERRYLVVIDSSKALSRPSTGCLVPKARCDAAATIRSRMSVTSSRMTWRSR
jgi:putative transposase